MEAAKQYIERKYQRLLWEEREKRDKWEQLVQKMQSLNYSASEQQVIKQDILHKDVYHIKIITNRPN